MFIPHVFVRGKCQGNSGERRAGKRFLGRSEKTGEDAVDEHAAATGWDTEYEGGRMQRERERPAKGGIPASVAMEGPRFRGEKEPDVQGKVCPEQGEQAGAKAPRPDLGASGVAAAKFLQGWLRWCSLFPGQEDCVQPLVHWWTRNDHVHLWGTVC